MSQRAYLEISNKTSKLNFEVNKKIIDAKLESIDTKHDTMWEKYLIEKWLFASAPLIVMASIFVLCKILKCRRLRSKKLHANEIEMRYLSDDHSCPKSVATDDSRPTKQHPHQQQQQLTHPNETAQKPAHCAEHVYTEVPPAKDKKVNFGLPPESSQFYQKCPKS
jgi:hypothetical protein